MLVSLRTLILRAVAIQYPVYFFVYLFTAVAYAYYFVGHFYIHAVVIMACVADSSPFQLCKTGHVSLIVARKAQFPIPRIGNLL